LLSLEIGTGTSSDDFSAIDWSAGPYFIKTATDPSGGSRYIITGTSQLMSVPFAMYAKTSGSSTPGPKGEPGAQGTNGTPGIQGETGSAGADGTNGTNGSNGAKGDQGVKGTAGADGTTGTAGADGTNGTNGTPGIQGETGTAGAAGTNGADGATGTNGTNGTPGIQGETGTAGAAGTNGADGATGTAGAAGTNGTNGTNGTPGIQGETGTAGAAGTNGADGATGTAGADGVNGEKGDTGDQGTQGIQGETGSVGTNGTQGETGAQGIQGETGAAGTNETHTGDVTGATVLTITNDAVTTAKILDANVTDAKIAAVSASKLTGVVGIAKGGTNIATYTQGDILYATSATELTKLPAGTAGQVLTMNTGATAPEWVAATTATYAIGDTHQGGIIFYLDASGKHGLISAPTDQSAGIKWDNESFVDTYAYGNGIGAGEGNSQGIRRWQGYCSSCYASELCQDLSLGGETDWYLPSKYELNLMFENIGQGNALGLGNIGNFANNYYWSSTEIDNKFAWRQYFGNGFQNYFNKDATNSVRAVRAF
jgi:hypothetical protein